MVTPAHSEWSDRSNLVKTISGIVATPRFCTPHDATYIPNDKSRPEDPTIIARTDEEINKEVYAHEGAMPLGATLSGHTGLRTWH